MKHSTIGTVIALAWALAAPAKAQQPQPPAQPPAQPPPAQPPAAPAPATPAPAAPAPAPAQPAPAPAQPAPAPAPAPAQPAPAPAPEQAAPAAPEAPAATPPAAATEAPPPVAAPPPAEPPAAPATAKAPETDEIAPPKPLLGLGLGTPDTGALPGRFRPAFGAPRRTVSDYKFDFHGFLTVPFRFGINKREDPTELQYETVLHGPPLVPDDFERFEHIGVIPQPWVQLAFSYGNSNAVATVIIAARSVSNAAGYFNPPTQLGINDAFVTFTPKFSGVDVEVDVGAFANRYGAMGDYDLGRYDTPVIARIGGVGETLRLSFPVAQGLTFLAEHGLASQLDRAPLGVDPAGWNSFADPNVGTTFAHHAHLGLAMSRVGQLALHYASAWSQDDRTAPLTPDGTITVFGADVTAEFGTFGRLYVGGAQTEADNSRNVSGVIRILNSFGGPGLMAEYFGPNSGGTGSLTTLGAQYDVSIGQIVRGDQPFSGYGPDVFASVFGMFTHVASDEAAYDGVDKYKYGAEIGYSMLPWLGLSGRYDRVVANTDDDTQTFAVLSPRIILRTDYNSQDQVTIQYSRWFYGSGVVVRSGYPPRPEPSLRPDEDTFSLTANMWW